MAIPVQLEDGNNNLGLAQNNTSEDEQLTRVFGPRKGELEVLMIRTVERVLLPVMEHFVRQIVKEQFELAQENLMTSIKCNFGNQASTSESRSLQLKFLDKISLLVFTGSKIQGEGCTSIRVALVDRLTGQVVNSGPEATANVEIVVLEGDSGGDRGDNEKVLDFNNKIVRERKGKRSILQGNTYLKLKNGICSIDELSFTHNSDWMKSCVLCLGARALDNFPGTTIEAAKTEPFNLKDFRTTFYEKHHPPSLLDEVWRLENICRNGAFCKRLSDEKIYTVKDFLKLLIVNPQRLRKILRVGAKTWKVIKNHAMTCDGGLYYYPNSQRGSGVVFNVEGQVQGLLRESQYFPIHMLSEKEKMDAHKMVRCAVEHWEEVIPYDDKTSLMEGSSHSSESARLESPSGHNCGDPPLMDTYNYTQTYNYTEPGTSSQGVHSYINCNGESSWLDFLDNPSDDLMEELLSATEQGSDFPIDSPDPIIHDFDVQEYMQFQKNDSSHQPKSNLELHTKKRWTVVFFVLKWFTIWRKMGSPERDHVQKKQKISICAEKSAQLIVT